MGSLVSGPFRRRTVYELPWTYTSAEFIATSSEPANDLPLRRFYLPTGAAFCILSITAPMLNVADFCR